ncbi:MAG: HAD-IC family P-type ATPase, partial [Acidimicrobiales bacterium]
DESLLTGESQAVPKRPGDPLLSGSIVTAGSARCQVTAVGASSFAGRITSEARRFTTTSSELVRGINRILACVAVAVAVTGPLLFVTQRRSAARWQEALHASVAGLVGIVPEGLVLLTSAAFFAAALSLARHRVLVRDLPAVEGLARIDVLCVDKTGTLTGGEIAFDHIEVLGSDPRPKVEAAVAALASQGAPNATARSLRLAFPSAPGWTRTAVVPFSSTRRWSAASFVQHGTWVLGAPDAVAPERIHPRARELAAEGHRTLMLARTASPVVTTALPPGLQPVALLVFEEVLRDDAAETMAYFGDQHVAIKVMSGDDPRTAAAVARQAGIGADAGVDARRLPQGGPDGLGPTVETNAVFGRVGPEQKRALVSALQARGHVVAMTGDGVNDVLALKQADIGVAMGSGAPATRSVAQLVLLGNEFSVMPRAVAEGRRVIANIERVAALFLTKNVTSLVLSVAVAAAGWPYPFLPRHGTLVSTIAIGIPGFFLALGPNPRRFEPGFVRRVLVFAMPAGAVISTAVASGYGLARADGLTLEEARTAATIVLLIASLWVLAIQARPLRRWKAALVGTMAGLGSLAFAVPWARAFFALRLPGAVAAGRSVVLGIAAAGAIELVSRHLPRRNRARRTAPAEDAAGKVCGRWGGAANVDAATIGGLS